MHSKTRTARSIIASGDSPLYAIADFWLEEVERYAAWWDWKDVSWNHGERAAVSILLSAVTRLGGVCIQEYKANKKKEGNECRGLCDVSLSFLHNGQRFDWDAEAKQISIPIRDTSLFSDAFQRGMSEAAHCVSELEHTGERMGLLFVTFTAYEQTDQNRLSDYIPKCEIALASLPQNNWFDVAAWFLTDRKMVSYLPGTALFIKRF